MAPDSYKIYEKNMFRNMFENEPNSVCIVNVAYGLG